MGFGAGRVGFEPSLRGFFEEGGGDVWLSACFGVGRDRGGTYPAPMKGGGAGIRLRAPGGGP